MIYSHRMVVSTFDTYKLANLKLCWVLDEVIIRLPTYTLFVVAEHESIVTYPWLFVRSHLFLKVVIYIFLDEVSYFKDYLRRLLFFLSGLWLLLSSISSFIWFAKGDL
jgi:hypothetical protein